VISSDWSIKRPKPLATGVISFPREPVLRATEERFEGHQSNEVWSQHQGISIKNSDPTIYRHFSDPHFRLLVAVDMSHEREYKYNLLSSTYHADLQCTWTDNRSFT